MTRSELSAEHQSQDAERADSKSDFKRHLEDLAALAGELSGQEVKDLYRQVLDNFTLPSGFDSAQYVALGNLLGGLDERYYRATVSNVAKGYSVHIPDGDYVTQRDVADILGVTSQTILNYLAKGTLLAAARIAVSPRHSIHLVRRQEAEDFIVTQVKKPDALGLLNVWSREDD